jgi:hypothetical protein
MTVAKLRSSRSHDRGERQRFLPAGAGRAIGVDLRETDA